MCLAVRVLVVSLLLVGNRGAWSAPQDHTVTSSSTSSEEGTTDDWPDQEAEESLRRHLFRNRPRQQGGRAQWLPPPWARPAEPRPNLPWHTSSRVTPRPARQPPKYSLRQSPFQGTYPFESEVRGEGYHSHIKFHPFGSNPAPNHPPTGQTFGNWGFSQFPPTGSESYTYENGPQNTDTFLDTSQEQDTSFFLPHETQKQSDATGAAPFSHNDQLLPDTTLDTLPYPDSFHDTFPQTGTHSDDQRDTYTPQFPPSLPSQQPENRYPPQFPSSLSSQQNDEYRPQFPPSLPSHHSEGRYKPQLPPGSPFRGSEEKNRPQFPPSLSSHHHEEEHPSQLPPSSPSQYSDDKYTSQFPPNSPPQNQRDKYTLQFPPSLPSQYPETQGFEYEEESESVPPQDSPPDTTPFLQPDQLAGILEGSQPEGIGETEASDASFHGLSEGGEADDAPVVEGTKDTSESPQENVAFLHIHDVLPPSGELETEIFEGEGSAPRPALTTDEEDSTLPYDFLDTEDPEINNSSSETPTGGEKTSKTREPHEDNYSEITEIDYYSETATTEAEDALEDLDSTAPKDYNPDYYDKLYDEFLDIYYDDSEQQKEKESDGQRSPPLDPTDGGVPTSTAPPVTSASPSLVTLLAATTITTTTNASAEDTTRGSVPPSTTVATTTTPSTDAHTPSGGGSSNERLTTTVPLSSAPSTSFPTTQPPKTSTTTTTTTTTPPPPLPTTTTTPPPPLPTTTTTIKPITTSTASTTTTSTTTTSPTTTTTTTTTSTTTTRTGGRKLGGERTENVRKGTAISLSEILQGLSLGLPQFLVALKTHGLTLKNFTTRVQEKGLTQAQFRKAKGNVDTLIAILKEGEDGEEAKEEEKEEEEEGGTTDRAEEEEGKKVSIIPYWLTSRPTWRPPTTTTTPATSTTTTTTSTTTTTTRPSLPPKIFGFRPGGRPQFTITQKETKETTSKESSEDEEGRGEGDIEAGDKREGNKDVKDGAPVPIKLDIASVMRNKGLSTSDMLHDLGSLFTMADSDDNNSDDSSDEDSLQVGSTNQTTSDEDENDTSSSTTANPTSSSSSPVSLKPYIPPRTPQRFRPRPYIPQGQHDGGTPRHIITNRHQTTTRMTLRPAYVPPPTTPYTPPQYPEAATAEPDTHAPKYTKDDYNRHTFDDYHHDHPVTTTSLNMTKSAIMAASVLGGVAMCVFLAILVVVMYRGRVRLRRTPLALASDSSTSSTPPLYVPRIRASVGKGPHQTAGFWGTLKKRFDPYSHSPAVSVMS